MRVYAVHQIEQLCCYSVVGVRRQKRSSGAGVRLFVLWEIPRTRSAGLHAQSLRPGIGPLGSHMYGKVLKVARLGQRW